MKGLHTGNMAPKGQRKKVEAKEFKCSSCEKQAVVFVGLNDPDGTQYPKCRDHADLWKAEIIIRLSDSPLDDAQALEAVAKYLKEER